ncbi:hypothetical protein [Sphingomonas sanguinis]|uniref:Uncharacterized protein n=1 Tax=Sphingomonas sanguinis TaxID=33051 RepID=A0A147HTN9_9SPHN|nr:hypothetical protein [Sphingomonas sanguinis]KTT68242.1 hypothetical protein NS319_14745 [Sphingomonas sanguinis]
MKDVLIEDARRLLAKLPSDRAAWPPLKWTIRPDVFDALRQDLEAAGAMITDAHDYPPTFLGLPYDLGWPDRGAFLTLCVSDG